MTPASTSNQPSRETADNLEALSFDELLERLEEIVAQLETDQLPLEASIDTYEAGMKLAARCQELLNRAELRISRIADESGATEPYDTSNFDGEDDEEQ